MRVFLFLWRMRLVTVGLLQGCYGTPEKNPTRTNLKSHSAPAAKQSSLVCLLYHKSGTVSIRTAFQNKIPTKPEGTADALHFQWQKWNSSLNACLEGISLFKICKPVGHVLMTAWYFPVIFNRCIIWCKSLSIKCRVARRRELLKPWFGQHLIELCNSGRTKNNWRVCLREIGDVNICWAASCVLWGVCMLFIAALVFAQHLTQRGFEPLLGVPRHYGTAVG